MGKKEHIRKLCHKVGVKMFSRSLFCGYVLFRARIMPFLRTSKQNGCMAKLGPLHIKHHEIAIVVVQDPEMKVLYHIRPYCGGDIPKNIGLT